MCIGCVADALDGEPVVFTDAMAELVPLVWQIYGTEWGSVGGPLHVQLDDFNLDDDFCTRECAEDALSSGWHAEADRDLILRTVDALAALSEPERAVAVAVAHEMLPPLAVGDTFTPPSEWQTRHLVIPEDSPGPCPACGCPLVATTTNNGARRDARCPAGHFAWTSFSSGALSIGMTGDPSDPRLN